MTAEATTPTQTPAAPDPTPVPGEGTLAVFRNANFLRLWLSQAATQIGGNMVLYGLTVIVLESTGLNTVVSLLILTFLVPAVLFSAVAGVYVDRIDRRLILVITNVLRGAMFVALFLVGDNLPLILLLNSSDLDGHRLLRTGRGGDDPAGRGAPAVAVRQRDLHAHAQCVVRPWIRAPRTAGREYRLARSGDPRRGRVVLPRGGVLLHPAEVAPAARAPDRSRLGVGEAEQAVELDLRSAARRPRLHPGAPRRQLVAHLPRDHRVARRRAGRARAGLREGDARSRAQGLRGRRAAARLRDRDRDPAAQRLRPLLPRVDGSSKAA